jgi:protein O-mannosyl-transferase
MTTNQIDQQGNRKRILIILLIGLVLTLIAFSPVLTAGFVNWDDDIYVVKNQTIQSFHQIGKIITEPVAGNFHPLTMLSLAIDYSLSGGNSKWFHFVNLLLHLINFVLVFFFIYCLTGKKIWIATITALLFVLHPLHVESVAWISERKDLLYSAFFLGGLLLYLQYLKDKRISTLTGVCILFLLSLLSKPAAVIFPLVLLAIDYYYNRLGDKKTYIEKIPLFVLSLLFGIITLTVQKGAGAYSAVALYPLLSRFFFANFGLMFYFFKTIVPFSLCAFYPYPAINQALPVVYYLSVLFTVGLIILFIFTMKRNKEVSFAILFYIINLVLVLQLFSVGSAVVADRYSYMPLVGPFFLVGYYLQKRIDKNRGKIPVAIGSISILVALAFVVIGRSQAATWKNGETLWDQAIKANPSGKAYSNRGLLYREAGDIENAFKMYSKAIELDSYESDALINRANIYFNRRQYSEAIADYSKCLEAEPNNDKAYSNRGTAYLALGKKEQALADLNRTIELNPSTTNGYKNRAMLYLMTGQYNLAIKDYSSHLSIAGDRDGEIYFKIGYCLQQTGNHQKAIEAFSRAIGVMEKGNFYGLRALSYYQLGNLNAATSDARKALSLGGQVDPELIKSLGLSM